jgi:hypothetical protein
VFSVLQVSSGALLMLFALLDVFLTVLYARAGTGIFSRFVCAWEWRLLRGMAKLLGRRAQLFLSLCGPAVVVSLISWWAFLLTLGAALMFHPYLGSAIALSSGSTPTDFVSAMYAAANSMSIVGSSGFSPQTSTFRLIFMLNSLVGMSVISLTLTYLMQIYNALQQRNSLGLQVFLLSGMTSSSAEMLVRIAPQGQWDSGFNSLSNVASSLAQLKELHHFYPVLLYFRFEEIYCSVFFVTGMLLDSVCLIESGLDAAVYGWVQRSATLAELWSASLLLLDLIERTFGQAVAVGPPRRTTESDTERWRLYYSRSLDLFESAGIAPASDVEQGANRYIELRQEWALRITTFADAMLYPADALDPGCAKESGSNPVLRLRARSHTSPPQSFHPKEK